MKYLVCLILCWAQLHGETNPPKKTICLNMIVKNESRVICRSLGSVKHLIDYWVIVDTGSTDNTPQIIRDFMKDIPGELHEQPWKNFEHNRNEALKLAKNHADYIFFMDADELLVFSEGFKLPPLEKDCYFVPVVDTNVTFQRIHLIKNSLDWVWQGVLHETLYAPGHLSYDVLPQVINSVVEKDGARAQDPDKYRKDAALLEQALLEHPDHSRYTFYLAQSYFNCGEYESALKAYEKRSKLKGIEEETFFSLYMIGKLKHVLKYPFEEVCQAYNIAYRYRPTRAEPLYQLGLLFLSKKEFVASFALLKLASSLPVPDDFLFVEQDLYRYILSFDTANLAVILNQKEFAIQEYKSLLLQDHLPENIRKLIEGNLASIEKVSTKEGESLK